MIVKEMTVPPQGEGERADKLIRRYFPELPERSVRDAFSRKDVKLDGKRVPKDTVVRAGQVLKIYTAEENAAGPEVVYEDARILLVNKPAGVSVEPDAKGGVTLTDLCAAYVRKENPAAEAPMACHRLDNPTCGLCLFAKDEETKEILEDMFRNRSMEKEYECLVRGLPKPPAAVCTAYLVKDAKAARVRVTDRPEEGAKKNRDRIRDQRGRAGEPPAGAADDRADAPDPRTSGRAGAPDSRG